MVGEGVETVDEAELPDEPRVRSAAGLSRSRVRIATSRCEAVLRRPPATASGSRSSSCGTRDRHDARGRGCTVVRPARRRTPPSCVPRGRRVSVIRRNRARRASDDRCNGHTRRERIASGGICKRLGPRSPWRRTTSSRRASRPRAHERSERRADKHGPSRVHRNVGARRMRVANLTIVDRPSSGLLRLDLETRGFHDVVDQTWLGLGSHISRAAYTNRLVTTAWVRSAPRSCLRLHAEPQVARSIPASGRARACSPRISSRSGCAPASSRPSRSVRSRRSGRRSRRSAGSTSASARRWCTTACAITCSPCFRMRTTRANTCARTTARSALLGTSLGHAIDDGRDEHECGDHRRDRRCEGGLSSDDRLVEPRRRVSRVRARGCDPDIGRARPRAMVSRHPNRASCHDDPWSTNRRQSQRRSHTRHRHRRSLREAGSLGRPSQLLNLSTRPAASAAVDPRHRGRAGRDGERGAAVPADDARARSRWPRGGHARPGQRYRPAGRAQAAARRDQFEEIVHRFAEEIRTVGQLEHPNIAPIHDVGIDDGGQHYFVMRYARRRRARSTC